MRVESQKLPASCAVGLIRYHQFPKMTGFLNILTNSRIKDEVGWPMGMGAGYRAELPANVLFFGFCCYKKGVSTVLTVYKKGNGEY